MVIAMEVEAVCYFTFSTVLVQICAVLDSGAVRRLCSKAITSAAMLLATWPLINGRTGSDLFNAGLKRRYYNERQFHTYFY